jgi:hypothetical protein
MEPLSLTEITMQPEAGVQLLTESEREALLADIHKEARKAGKRKGWFITLLLLSILLNALLMAIGGTTHNDSLIFFGYLSLYLAPISLYVWYKWRRKKSAVEKLANQQDLWAVGPLADMLASPDSHARTIASRGLAVLLPQLKASDGALLNNSQRENLRRAFTLWHLPLALAVLKAYQQIGDERDVGTVRGLLQADDSRECIARHPAVREAAYECLPFLLEKSKLSYGRQILLRPAEQPPTPTAELLRPASAGNSSDPQHLLRPATGQGSFSPP